MIDESKLMINFFFCIRLVFLLHPKEFQTALIKSFSIENNNKWNTLQFILGPTTLFGDSSLRSE